MVRYCIAIVVGSLATLIGMGFQPGWANGWPGGISQDVVFRVVCDRDFAAYPVSQRRLLTVPCIAAERRIKRPFVGWTLFICCLDDCVHRRRCGLSARVCFGKGFDGS
ncbi:MAG: hypothetical protein U0992_23685 [Planctomycetaceae bacterium]